MTFRSDIPIVLYKKRYISPITGPRCPDYVTI